MKRDWNVICERTGMKFPRKDVYREWTGLWVHKDVVNLRPAQDYVKSIPDDPAVEPVFPSIVQAVGETTVSSDVEIWTDRVYLTSVGDVNDQDPIGIVMDNGATHWSFVEGDPVPEGGGDYFLLEDGGFGLLEDGERILLEGSSGSYGYVVLNTPVSYKCSSGNVVYLPSVNNEDWE